jgi:hypothetical protein
MLIFKQASQSSHKSHSSVREHRVSRTGRKILIQASQEATLGRSRRFGKDKCRVRSDSCSASEPILVDYSALLWGSVTLIRIPPRVILASLDEWGLLGAEKAPVFPHSLLISSFPSPFSLYISHGNNTPHTSSLYLLSNYIFGPVVYTSSK